MPICVYAVSFTRHRISVYIFSSVVAMAIQYTYTTLFFFLKENLFFKRIESIGSFPFISEHLVFLW